MLGGIALAGAFDEAVQHDSQDDRSRLGDNVAAVARHMGQPEVFATIPCALLTKSRNTRCLDRLGTFSIVMRSGLDSTTSRSNSGQARRNSQYSSSVQKPITCSTPARLYQLRSKSTISPAAGR